MIDGWEPQKIGQVIKLEYGKSLKGYHEDEGSVQVFGTNGPIGYTNEALYSRPSLIIGRKGAYRGVHYSPGPLFVIDTAFYTRSLQAGLSEKFLYYWFQTIDFDDMDSGSAIPSTSRDEVHDLNIMLPPPLEQKAIAEVLSSLDDKIDLLHRQNATLEALAETLFRRYFIEGAQDDWEESTLDDVLTVKGGTTPSTSNAAFWDGDIHWTSPKDLSANDGLFLLDTARKITPEGLAQIGSGLLPAGSLLMSSRAPVGYLAFSVNPVAINQGYIGILDDKGFSKEFIFLWLKINMEYVKGHANGSTFQEISKSTFKRLEITKPPEQLRQEFQGLVLPLFQKLLENTLQCQKLRQLRDTLLPKLMSGQVRVDVSA